ncbi:GntR family transcriptional regulator [Actinoplanes philippinensis]|uniref:GntR family transcriptional regulator n=1 Tax=Actinoplanes philippinensis TaxID=35752 RepID=A0A1I2EQ13_9ACTN|nr:GntR family transcriptional regulator [Actinoplanes philippinensis]GIE82501.1 GntR family transcriptional regulator [Actinoplanes philippinensis]SFE94929.1 GntR family transcriptional regulator [Actinoplanes philippinensis]
MRRAEVRDRLRELIDARAPGDPMPSERSLSELLGASRPTVRAAIDDLVGTGHLVRQHGRGTFTSPHKISQEVPAFGEPVPPADGDWTSEVLRFRVEAAGARLGRRLQVSPGDAVLYVKRRRIVDGAPMAIEEIRLPAALAPGIEAGEFVSGSLYRRLRERYGVNPAEAVQTVEPTVTDAEEARLLEVPLHSPALLFERTTQDDGGRVIEFTRSIYRGDRYRITTHLRLGPHSG